MMTDFEISSDLEIKKSLKRKFENVENQILDLSLNKKLKEIGKKILDLNDDCLAEIFMYIPIYERPKIALVCKKWHEALHLTWYKVKALKLSHWEYHTYQNIFEQFKKTNRLIFLQSLLDNCGIYLTELDLVAYDNSDIMPFVNKSCPNVVKLRLRFKFIINKELSNAFSRMLKLKILKIIFHLTHGIPITILNSLKGVANTLSELTLAYWNNTDVISKYKLPNSFATIIVQLKNLEKIQITGLKITKSLSKFMVKANLINQDDNNYFTNFISRRYFNICGQIEHLTKLSFIDYAVTDDVLYTFANIVPCLEMINVISTYVTDIGIQTITRMKYLRFLYLHGPNQHITDSSIKLLKHLEKLHLPYSNKITNASVIKVLENSPLMKWLTIINTGVTPIFARKASIIAFKHNNSLILCVNWNENTFSSRGYQLPYLEVHHHAENIQLNKYCTGCCYEQVDLVYYK